MKHTEEGRSEAQRLLPLPRMRHEVKLEAFEGTIDFGTALGIEEEREEDAKEEEHEEPIEEEPEGKEEDEQEESKDLTQLSHDMASFL